MSVANPGYLHQFLAECKARPKKSLSQNFLIDQNIVAKIVRSMRLDKEPVLEIGAGPGALTEELAKVASKLYLVEKDHTFALSLKRFREAQVFEGDFFDFDLNSLPKGCKVVSNLPYHLTSPILTTLLPLHKHFSTLTLMMQKEVADRLRAKPGIKAYGSLTLFAQFYADIIDHFPVKASCFYPQPKVDSTVLTFRLKQPPKEIDEERFFALTRAAFHTRRKMLRSSLKTLYKEKLIQSLHNSQISPLARPEELSLEQFISLFIHLSNY